MDNNSELGKTFAHLVATELKGAITARGFTVAQVCEQIGTYPTTFSRYFAGKRSMTLDTFYAVCAVIGIEPAEIADRATKRMETETPATYSTKDTYVRDYTEAARNRNTE